MPTKAEIARRERKAYLALVRHLTDATTGERIPDPTRKQVRDAYVTIARAVINDHLRMLAEERVAGDEFTSDTWTDCAIELDRDELEEFGLAVMDEVRLITLGRAT